MKIVIAPNAFKHSLPAAEVAKAIQEGILRSHPDYETVCLPIGDGGDGTGALIQRYVKADFIPAAVSDPLQRVVQAGFGLSGATAIIEMADASGIKLLTRDEYNPRLAQTRGLGQLIKAALEKNVTKIILCIGGSATVDGGSGLLQELGARFLDEQGEELTALPLELPRLYRIDRQGLDPGLQKTEIVVLCDVKNKLLGAEGAAAVFGPQKGASPSDVLFLEKALAQLDAVVFATTGKRMSELEGGGAAGGLGAALAAFCNAKMVSGIDYLLELIEIEKYLHQADLVITGEGTVDSQTFLGKAPFGVARAAKKHNLPVVALAGKVVKEGENFWKNYFDRVVCITPPGAPIKKALQDTRKNLVQAASQLFR